MRIFLAHSLSVLLSFGKGDLIHPVDCEQHCLETTFETNVHVDITVSYPQLMETSLLARHANDAISQEAYELHNANIQEMSAPCTELWEEGDDEYTLHWGLNLVYSKPDLVSFYGSQYRYCGGGHGSVRYITKTFWQSDDVVHSVSLDDLLLPEAREWLFQHCQNYFKENRCGYYSDDDISWIPFNPEHLDAFVVIEKGLLLIFQNYTVGGFDDEPITLLIPYDKLISIAKPNGPLINLELLNKSF